MKDREVRFAIIVAGLYAIAVALGLWHHEPFRDEWQAWLLARDATSPQDLLHKMRYEGHPAGWYMLLFGLSRLTPSFAAAQVLHLVLATAGLWLFLRYAPLGRAVKVLFAFGYFPLYEYAILTRSYVLGMLLLFAACAAWRVRHRSPWPLAIALALLVQTSAYGVLLAFAVCVAAAVEWLLDPGLRRARPAATGLAIALVAASTIASVATMRPPADAGFTGQSLADVEATPVGALRSSLLVPVRVLAPVPPIENGIPIWGETLAVEQGALPNAPIFGVVAVLVLAVLVARRPAALAALVTGGVALLAFTTLIHSGKMRHHGHLLLLFVACLWLAAEHGVEWRREGAATFLKRLEPAGRATLIGVLALQVIAGALLYAGDLRLPFTTAPAAASAIRAHGGTVIAGTQAAYMTSLAGALDRPVYIVESGRSITWVPWNEVRRPAPPEALLAALRPVVDTAGPVVLVTPYPLPDLEAAGATATPIHAPGPSMIRDEHLWAWEVKRTR